MKQLTFFSKFFVLAVALSFWTSCETDDGTGGGGFVLGPTVELKSGADLVSSDATVNPNEVFKVNVSIAKGDNDMTTFTILENGIAIDASRLNYNSAGAGATSNPYSLTAAEAAFFDTNIEITAQASGDVTYTFRMADSAGESDETTINISVASTPLSFGFDAANGGFAADATLPTASYFKVELVATKGSSPLSTLTVWEDGVEVDVARLSFGTENDFLLSDAFPTNPLDLVNDEKDGFTYFVWINSHDEGAHTYTYQLTDDLGASEELSLVITVQPITELSGKLLSNASGPVGTGGIDLATGDETGSNDATADIKDLGNISTTSQTWVQKIAPTNNSVFKSPAADFPVDGFDLIAFPSEVQAAFDAGDVIAESNVVAIGDVFLVQSVNDGNTYIVEVTNIVETTTDNLDYYELKIKY
ncbi:MAG: hypothetical protein AB8H03_15920 [Saprospiraceae bacterium]